MKRRMISALLTSALLLSLLVACGSRQAEVEETPSDQSQIQTLAAEGESTAFADVPADADYAQAVAWCQEQGLMSGTAPNTFAPDMTLNRAMVATVLYRAEKEPQVEWADTFGDVPTGQWYSSAITWANAAGVVGGYDNGLYGTFDAITREQLATILWRYDGQKTVDQARISDRNSVSSYAQSAVDWAVGAGVMAYRSDASFAPKDYATRAEAAMAFYATLSAKMEGSGAQGSKVLVAYFSRTGENYNVGVIEKGNTHIIADMIAQETGADTFELVPAVPYPEVYSECTAVAQEEKNANARPALTADLENLEDYDMIFLGYPIWWGDMPMAVYTFLEAHDWTNKTVVPFCTHAGSGLSGTVNSIRNTCTGAEVLSGLAVAGTTAQNDQTTAKQAVVDWLSGIDLPQPQEPVTVTSITTNGGETIELSDLEYLSSDSGSTVYFISDIAPEAMVAVYDALGWEPTGKVAVKLSTGEPPASNYLRPELIRDVVEKVAGTIVECNTAYGGSRASTAMHYQVAKDHGFTDIADFQILDENGSMTLPVNGGTVLNENYVGEHFADYDSYLVLSHFKGHAMAGYGGAIKNISIGLGSSEGKCWIHSGGKSLTSPWGGDQTAFTESMAEAGKSVSDYLGEGERIVYISVMNRISIDCDCNGNPAEPDIHDIGILASTDPVALDQACIDIVSHAKGSESLLRRIERQNGIHTLEHAQEIGLGNREYQLRLVGLN